MSDSLPMSSPWHKHLVERKLSMQVFLNHIKPFGVPGLAIQLLTKHMERTVRCLYYTLTALWAMGFQIWNNSKSGYLKYTTQKYFLLQNICNLNKNQSFIHYELLILHFKLTELNVNSLQSCVECIRVLNQRSNTSGVDTVSNEI